MIRNISFAQPAKTYKAKTELERAVSKLPLAGAVSVTIHYTSFGRLVPVFHCFEVAQDAVSLAQQGFMVHS